MQIDLTTKPTMFALSPLVQLRIACRRVANTWRESEWMQPACVAAVILIVLFAPMAVIVWHVWFR